MGLWKVLEKQNVAMMKIHPRRDIVEHILSMRLMSRSCCAVSPFAIMLNLLESNQIKALEKALLIVGAGVFGIAR